MTNKRLYMKANKFGEVGNHESGYGNWTDTKSGKVVLEPGEKGWEVTPWDKRALDIGGTYVYHTKSSNNNKYLGELLEETDRHIKIHCQLRNERTSIRKDLLTDIWKALK